jgi:hypothetical protein
MCGAMEGGIGTPLDGCDVVYWIPVVALPKGH